MEKTPVRPAWHRGLSACKRPRGRRHYAMAGAQRMTRSPVVLARSKCGQLMAAPLLPRWCRANGGLVGGPLLEASINGCLTTANSEQWLGELYP